MRKTLKSILPNIILYFILYFKESYKLKKIKTKKFLFQNLSHKINLQNIFLNKEIETKYNMQLKILSYLKIPDLSGGVNEGDRRAIYYLCEYYKPKKFLEIGTHIGSSTSYIACNMNNYYDQNVKFYTVDINDVNDEIKKPWLKFKSTHSPKKMIGSLNLNFKVNFIHDDSINFLKKTEQKFDFIFLDGNHSAEYVYQEISLSLKILRKNGLILLHDYFMNGKEIWENKIPILGPYLAIERIKKENNKIEAMSFRNLPWKTKFNSNHSSLALIYKY